MTAENFILTGAIKNLQVHKDRIGEKMAFANLENGNNKINVVFFSRAWKQCEAKIKDNKIVTLSGKMDSNIQNQKAGKNYFMVNYVLPRVKKTEEALKTNWAFIYAPQAESKMMKFKIHRSTKETGVACVEVWTDTSRIVIDMGIPLANADETPFKEKEIENLPREELIKNQILPDIPALYEDTPNTALLISHAHKDHYGLIGHIRQSCPVYMGNAAHHLIALTYDFLSLGFPIKNIKHFKHEKTFKVGDIEITPYLMDYSVLDVYLFLIRVDEKYLLYSGDFRNHGRKSRMFDIFCSKVHKGVDYMLLEGSSMGRTEKPFPKEYDLEANFIDTFKKTKGINLVLVSGLNIDILVTIYRACKHFKKIFLLDFYTANVLKTLNKKANSTIPHPSRENFKEINVYFPHYHAKIIEERGNADKFIKPFKFHEIPLDQLDSLANKLVMLVHPHVIYDLQKGLHNYSDGCFIYSMGEGYKKDAKNEKLLDFISAKGMPIKDIHTSSHADLAALKMMADAVKPKHIIPIHTFEDDSYAKYFNDHKVVIVNDKEVIDI